MEQIELKATSREVLGKKVRFLRRQGITPLNLFGHGIRSVAMQCDTANLRQVLAEAGRTRLISLKLDNEKTPKNVIVRQIQIEPRTEEILHIDFYQVSMTEQVKVEIPVIFVGEAPALKLKENMLATGLDTLSIECLPAEIPDSISVDLTSLTESEQAIRVKDIKLDKGITILNEPDVVVVRIALRPAEKIEEPVPVVSEAVEAPQAPSPSTEESREP